MTTSIIKCEINYLYIPELQHSGRWIWGKDNKFLHTLQCACDYLSILGLKLIHVSKRDPLRTEYMYAETNGGGISKPDVSLV